MHCCTACYHADTFTVLQNIIRHTVCFQRNASIHISRCQCCLDCFRLFHDFFLHIEWIVAFACSCCIPVNIQEFCLAKFILHIINTDVICMQFNDVIFRNYHIACCLTAKSSHIRCQHGTVFTISSNDWADITDSKNHIRDIIKNNHKGKSTFQAFHCLEKCFVRITCIKTVQYRSNNFTVCIRNQFIRQAKMILQLFIILNNTIVNQCDTSCTMRMCIHIADTAMGCPTCMTNTANTIHRISLPYLFKVCYSSGTLTDLHLAVCLINNCHTSTVITTILQQFQCIKNLLCNTLFTCITYYSTHNFSSLSISLRIGLSAQFRYFL